MRTFVDWGGFGDSSGRGCDVTDARVFFRGLYQNTTDMAEMDVRSAEITEIGALCFNKQQCRISQ